MDNTTRAMCMEFLRKQIDAERRLAERCSTAGYVLNMREHLANATRLQTAIDTIYSITVPAITPEPQSIAIRHERQEALHTRAGYDYN